MADEDADVVADLLGQRRRMDDLAADTALPELLKVAMAFLDHLARTPLPATERTAMAPGSV